jgi:hypothetical protein
VVDLDIQILDNVKHLPRSTKKLLSYLPVEIDKQVSPSQSFLVASLLDKYRLKKRWVRKQSNDVALGRALTAIEVECASDNGKPSA